MVITIIDKLKKAQNYSISLQAIQHHVPIESEFHSKQVNTIFTLPQLLRFQK